MFEIGEKVQAFQYCKFINDDITPIDTLLLPAKVVCEYGEDILFGGYRHMITVEFDDAPGERHTYLPQGIRKLN